MFLLKILIPEGNKIKFYITEAFLSLLFAIS